MCKHFTATEVKCFILHMIVSIWKYLLIRMVEVRTINKFKNRVDKCFASSPQLTLFVPQDNLQIIVDELDVCLLNFTPLIWEFLMSFCHKSLERTYWSAAV